jgi:3-oxoacyl-[acyl-carrier-protein] synthase-3
VVVEGTADGDERGLLATKLFTNGSNIEALYTAGVGFRRRPYVDHRQLDATEHIPVMEGREVFKHAVAMITDVIEDAFKATGYTAADIDWFVPHQANKRIIDGSAHKLGIAPEKVVITVDRHGNTSAASIPLALADAVTDRRIKRGHLILLEAMGGGFTWGSALLRW